MKSDATTTPTTALATLDPQRLLAQAVETGAGIETIERFVALAKDVRAMQAKQAFDEAKAEFQRTCPPIHKSKSANIRPGFSYKYAPLDEVTRVTYPVMAPLGLSTRWRTRPEGQTIVVACVLSHVLGHSEESGDLAMPIATGDSGATPPQWIGIAVAYGKRYTLLSVLGLAPEDEDTDGVDEAKPPRTMDGAPKPPDEPAQNPESVVNENQIRRMMAIAGRRWTEEQLHDLISGFGYNSRKEIKAKDYDAIVEKLKGAPGKAA